jgi:G3E family GTPase
MATATFDTLKLAKTLKATGFPDEQAKALATAFADMVQVNFKDLATKEDLERVAREVRGEFERFAKELRVEMERVAREQRVETERVAKEAKDNLDQATKDVRRDIADLRTELKHFNQTTKTKHDADLFILKSMFGVGITVGVAILGLLGP